MELRCIKHLYVLISLFLASCAVKEKITGKYHIDYGMTHVEMTLNGGKYIQKYSGDLSRGSYLFGKYKVHGKKILLSNDLNAINNLRKNDYAIFGYDSTNLENRVYVYINGEIVKDSVRVIGDGGKGSDIFYTYSGYAVVGDLKNVDSLVITNEIGYSFGVIKLDHSHSSNRIYYSCFDNIGTLSHYYYYDSVLIFKNGRLGVRSDKRGKILFYKKEN